MRSWIRRWFDWQDGPALERARGALTAAGLPWGRVDLIHHRRSEWLLVCAWDIYLSLSCGSARVSVAGGRVAGCEFISTDPAFEMVPPWHAYPSYNSVTSGWRQGSGEVYLNGWWAWWHLLDSDQRAAYQAKYPPPGWGAWEWFYSGFQPPPAGATSG